MNEFDARVVYTSLQQSLSDRSVVREAFQAWQKELADQDFDAVAIVEHLQSFMGLSTAERKSLMIGLFANVSRRLDELKELPSYLQTSAAATPDTSEAATKPKTEVRGGPVGMTELFFNFTNEVMAERKTRNADDYYSALSEEGLPGVDSQVAQAIKLGAQRRSTRLSDQLSLSQCQAILHEQYMLLIETVGPVEADHVYSAVVSRLMKHPASKDFDPRELIDE